MGHPAGVSQKSDGRQPCGRRDACVENRCSVVPRCLTSLSVGMLVRKCWLCESVRAAVTNTTGWVAETAAFFFFFLSWNCFYWGYCSRPAMVGLVFCPWRQLKPGASTHHLPALVEHAEFSSAQSLSRVRLFATS